MRAAVLVLGDLGRSPRTLLHARALAAEGLDVDLIGSGGSALPDSIVRNPRIAVHTLDDEPPAKSAGTLYLLGSGWRGLRLLMSLLALLGWRLARPDLILVQNPPGVPTLAVAWLAARLRGSRLAVDWHNLTSAMISLRLGAGHPLVGWIDRYECWIGRRADVNLFVSAHMQALLAARCGLKGTVFRDRPAAIFAALQEDDRKQARAHLVTEDSRSRARALLISATSWTADENLDLFLDALERYDRLARVDQTPDGLPPVVAVITGRGALKGAFDERVARTPLACVEIRTAWLEPDEYPRALAAADLGMCFHTSASGLDIPMKIADMFGAGLPVCAFDYGPCLQEVLRPGVNGELFRDADDCLAHLARLLRGFPGPNAGLADLRRGVREATMLTWEVAWIAEVRDTLLPSRGLDRGKPRLESAGDAG